MIDRLAHDGRGVARDAQGKTLFVEGALPGERVEVAIHRQRQRFDEAHVRTRFNDAPQRVTPPCEYAQRCGGCDLQHLDVPAQRQHKQRVLSELLAHQGIELKTPPELLAGHDGGYRRRARLGVKGNASGVHLGFRARGSEQLIDIAHCYVLEPRLAALLPSLRQQLESLEVPRHVGHVELLGGEGPRPTVVVRQLRDVTEDIQRWRAFAEREQVNLALLLGRHAPKLEWLSAQDSTAISIARGDKSPLTLSLSPGDFVQINAEVNQRLIDTVREWLAPRGDERLLDLFAGIGNFSLALAADVFSVTAVEGSNAMVERLRDNARHNGLGNVAARQGDLSVADAELQALLTTHDSVILDPPRSGAQALCQRLASSEVARILYVACDPASLARDAGILTAGGYTLERSAVADMFPHTAHLESLALFVR